MSIKEYIDQAIKEGKSVTISYMKYGGELSTRKISDIKYSDEFGLDYISAYCHLRNENRTFKISRIQKVDGITTSKPVGSIAKTGGITPRTIYRTSSSLHMLDDRLSNINTTINTTKPVNNTTLSTSNRNNISSYTKAEKKSVYSSQKKKEGCYIATMTYGSYDHPKVLVLRQYRDKVLLKTALGQLFVKTYYTVSPYMVVFLRQHRRTNRIIRIVLDGFVCKISKKYHM